MQLAQVVGHVVSTVKNKDLCIGKLLLVRFLDNNGKPAGHSEVALDTVGAGEEEVVLVVRGSSARESVQGRSCTDLSVVGIVDTVSHSGKTIYSKG